jgi:hypothetical protein
MREISTSRSKLGSFLVRRVKEKSLCLYKTEEDVRTRKGGGAAFSGDMR